MSEYVAESILVVAALFIICSSLFTPDNGRPKPSSWIHAVSLSLMFVGGASKSGPYWLFALAIAGLVAIGCYLIWLSGQIDKRQITPQP